MDKIREAIAKGKLEEALELFCESSQREGLILLSQFNDAKRQYSLGMIDFSEWSRIRTKISAAVTALMDDLPKIVNPTTLTHISNLTQQVMSNIPGNELALFNDAFRRLEKMVEDHHAPIQDIIKIVKTFDSILGLPEMVGAAEDFQKTRHVSLLPADREKERLAFVKTLLSNKKDFIEAAEKILQMNESNLGWRDAWHLVETNPSPQNFEVADDAISDRLATALFPAEIFETWKELSQPVGEIPRDYLWRHTFVNYHLPDLRKFVQENLH